MYDKPTYEELEELVKSLQCEISDLKRINSSFPVNEKTIRDAELKIARDKAQKSNRVLAALSSANDVLIHATDEEDLLSNICSVIVNDGGYKLAWVGYGENDRKKSVKVMGSCGATGYLEKIEVRWSDTKLGRGPSGAPIRTGKIVTIKEVDKDPKFLPWFKVAKNYGLRSVLGLPITVGTQIIGSLTIYSAEADAFDKDEKELLKKLSENLSFGINTLRGRKLKEKSVEQVRSLAKALDTTATGITISNLDGEIIYLNPAEAEMHGYSTEELVGKNVQVFAPPEIRKPIGFEEMTELVERRRESVNVRKDGSKFSVYLVSDVVKNDAGLPVGFVTTCEDITERKLAEAKLRESEERLQSIIDNSLSTIFVKDMDGRYMMINRTLASLLDKNKESIIGKVDQDLFPEATAAKLRYDDTKVIGDGTPLLYEESVLMGDGMEHTFITNKFPLKDAEGKAYAICGISTDITRRKKVEEDMLKSNVMLEAIRLVHTKFIGEEDYGSIFDELLHTLLALTESDYGFIGEINSDKGSPQLLKSRMVSNVKWNKKTQKFYDERVKNLVMSNQDSLYGAVISSGKVVIANDPATDSRSGSVPDAHPPINSFMGLPLYLGKSLIGVAGVANCKEGYSEDVAEFLEPFLSTCANIIDATSQKEHRRLAEKRLEQSHEELRSLIKHAETLQEEERKKIARNIHDDLGQLLTVLKFDLAWISKRLGAGHGNIYKKLGESEKLIDSSIETVQKISSELRPTILDDLGIVAGMGWQVDEFMNRTGIKCTITFEPPDIDLDETLSTELFRIFQEALTNVARHSGATHVNVLLKLNGDKILLEVKDNGKGIANDRISVPSSIGLIGIRERIHPWGGDLSMSGSPGEGTTLRVSVIYGQSLDRMK